MSLTAAKLSKAGTRSREIDTLIRERLQYIDAELGKHVPLWGINAVRVELPTTFALPGLDRSDAQRLVYSQILESVQARGFTTGIVIGEAATFLHIGWLHEFSLQELEAMNATIRVARINDRDPVAAFRARIANTAVPVRTTRAPVALAAALVPKEQPAMARGALPGWAS
jgi:hypothetical protein